MAYDPVDGYLVLFGGCIGGNLWYSTCTPSNQTWAYLNGSWSELFPTITPPARYFTNLAWAGNETGIVMFGGNGSSSFLNDTWTFLHGQWTQQFPTTIPPARAAAGMVYDAAAGYVLLTDGEQYRTLTDLATETYDGADYNDSWAYSNGNWMALSVANNPSARDQVSMTYDATLQEVVLFGGFNWTTYNQDDTWVFSGGSWTDLSTGGTNGSGYSSGPYARNNGAFAYDPSLGADILFGGHNGFWFANDTWEFTASGWSQVNAPSAPSVRWASGLAYDPTVGCLVLYGGYRALSWSASTPGQLLNDTWTWCGAPGASGGSGSSGNGSSGNGSSGNGSSGNGSSGSGSPGNGSSGNGSSGNGSSSNGSSPSGPGGSTGTGHAGTTHTLRAHASRPVRTGSLPLTPGDNAAPSPSSSGIWISPIGFLLYVVLSTGLLAFIVVVRTKTRPKA
jgi:hypothetical protein